LEGGESEFALRVRAPGGGDTECEIGEGHQGAFQRLAVKTDHAAHTDHPRALPLGLRIARARELLARMSLAMSAVAQRSGFTDGKHLATVFRQEMGLTPSAYRAQLQSG